MSFCISLTREGGAVGTGLGELALCGMALDLDVEDGAALFLLVCLVLVVVVGFDFDLRLEVVAEDKKLAERSL